MPSSRPAQLYYVTDRSQFPGDSSAQLAVLRQHIAQAVAAGIDFIQLREKDLSGRTLESLARHSAAIIAASPSARSGPDAAKPTGEESVGSTSAPSRTRLLINGRIDIALAVGAYGVHLPAQGLSVAEARAISRSAGRESLAVGASCHSVHEVDRAVADGAAWVVFGPVFEKALHPQLVATGLAELAAASRAIGPVPVFAIGGVTRQNLRSCLDAGATGVAGIRMFQEADPAAVVAALRRLKHIL